ncbi:MAG: ribonucleoside-diphosphate reductase subunit alpha [Bdellovibrionales bacterium]|nr:ribonucleoside-diphosphate reductase subunit alpha [Bdellovibrionales bacterium]
MVAKTTPMDPTSTEDESPIIMRVKKRDGSLQPVDVNKIVNVVLACSTGLKEVDPMRVASKAISGLYDGATTKELDELSIRTAAMMISEEPDYSKLASRLLARYIDEEVRSQGIHDFVQSVRVGFEHGLISEEKYNFVVEHKEALNITIDNSRTRLFEYFGLKTVYDRYLIKNPITRQVIETPQFFFLRVACGLSNSFQEAKEFYDLLSNLDYLTSSPTLFNSATQRPQLSSCYLLDSPQDDLSSIYDKYKDIALLSKFAGGIGVSFSRIRSRGSLIKGTNGHSNGLVPWLKTLDSSVSAVNQGGRRKGAACVYLESWHGDIEEFLELRDNTGDEAQRTHNLNLANWVPDVFMRRVDQDEMWSLFDPKAVPEFIDLYGEEFEKAYLQAEKEGKYIKQVKARDLYGRMMKTLAQTGNGWMTFKDASNLKANQTGLKKENVIHLSNLCTEILEVTSNKESAVCNLGSVNLANHVKEEGFDFKKLADTVKVAVKYLDKVIDINFYPIPQAESSNNRWRPIGLGVMGLQDVFFKMGMAFDSPEAKELSAKIQEEIYYNALKTSCELAEKNGPHDAFGETRASQGHLQFDLWNVVPSDMKRWEELRRKVKKIGLRNSLMIAIAPTATIASICGVYEAIEPQVSNYFKRETLSGEFIQINKYLVSELKKIGLWNESIRAKIKSSEGSIQGISEIPEHLRNIYRTVWEIPQKELIDMAADRGAFIDQSQSLNLFLESPTIGKLSSMYMYAWKKGIKTTYYLRSRPATRIAKVTLGGTPKKTYTDEEALACSLENPEICEACQ